MKLKNVKWSTDQFIKMRKDVLDQWPTGQEVDLNEGIKYQRSLPSHKIMNKVLKNAEDNGVTLVQPRAGVALLDEHIELLRFLQDEGGADLLPTTIDSYTRQNRFKDAQRGIEESRDKGRSMLNGFPAVNHGISACRKVVEALDRPLQVRHGTPDARLLAEITIAGGFSDYEGGGISYNIPYAKKVSLENTIYYWQYVDRLIGYYWEEGKVAINREPFGPLTGTLVPPSISHSVAIIEALLAAEQGVKNITLGYGQCGNITQDIAALHTLKTLGREYLTRFGYDDVQLTTVLHQWMGGFPQDEAKAFAVISWGAVAAALGNATKVIVKTPHEAMGIPTKEANAQGLKTSKQIIRMLKDQKLEQPQRLNQEKELIICETKAILEKVFEIGNGDWAIGAVRGFERGILDIPFAPSTNNIGKVLTARDNEGAVRFLEFGNLPLNNDIKAFHKNALNERGQYEGRKPSFQMVIDDIYAVSNGELIGRPKKAV